MDAASQLVARIFVALFFAGVVGSMIVVIISFVEDLELLVDTDDGTGNETAIIAPR
jgi:hypothetical protein